MSKAREPIARFPAVRRAALLFEKSEQGFGLGEMLGPVRGNRAYP